MVKRLPRYPDVPATLPGRLAVSVAHRGKELEEFLLLDAFFRAFKGAEQVASTAVVVDANDEAARNFYMKYGFAPLPSRPNRLLYPMAIVGKLFVS
jgi:ribosomal protein S18 acetylase RimI-like enzyme